MADEIENGTQGAQGGASGDGTTGQGAGTANSNTQTDSSSDGAQSGTETEQDKVDRAEYERLKNQLSAADKRREELERRFKEQEDKEKDELTKATERAEELNQKVSLLEQQITQLRLEKAMLSDPEFGADKWQDPEEVLDKVNRAVSEERITVKDGQPEATSVKAFLKDLATKKPYLLKTTAGSAAGGSSGANVGGGDRRKAGDSDSDNEIRKRYRIR